MVYNIHIKGQSLNEERIAISTELIYVFQFHLLETIVCGNSRSISQDLSII